LVFVGFLNCDVITVKNEFPGHCPLGYLPSWRSQRVGWFPDVPFSRQSWWHFGNGNGFSVWALGLKPKISNPFFEGWCDIANSIGSRYERIHSSNLT
jgi:hypothetical protein